MRVLVTGDRSMPPAVSVPTVATTLLKLVNANTATTIAYGNAVGVEAAVGFVLDCADVELKEQFQYVLNEKGGPDFAETYRNFSEAFDKVVVIHGDVHSSRIFKAAVEVFGEDKVELVLPQLLFV